MSSQRRRGHGAEDKAAEILSQEGMRILERNYHCYRGEIDIVALDSQTVVFVEVKERSEHSYGTPEAAVTPRKKRRMVACSKRWIMENGHQWDIRFDVVAFRSEDYSHYRDAFHLSEIPGYT